MKKLISIAAVAALGMMALSSCSDMNSLHEIYLLRGETVYAAKIDSAEALIGINEQELHIYTPKQRIKSGVVRWNLGADSVTFDIPNPVPEYIKVTVPDLEEGNYTYEIYTYDAYGNISIGEEITSNVISRGTYEDKLKIAKTSFYYSEYDRILAEQGGSGGSGPAASISNAQNFNGSAWFMWDNDALPGAKIIFRYQNLEGVEVTYTFDGSECKKSSWCSKLSNALCTPASTVVFHYHTEYPGTDISAEIATTIDLGEEYVEEIRYYNYSDKIEVHTQGVVYPEVEDIW